MRAILLVTFLSTAFAAHSQSARQAEELQAQLQAAQTQAAAAAAQPGDETLTCEQLQTELNAAAQNPDFQAGLQSFGAQAQADQKTLDDARQQLEGQTQAPKRGIFKSMAQGIATAALPNSVGGAAQQAAATAQAAQMQAQAAQRQQQMFGQAPQLTGMMGPAMRGQHLIELAQARNCEWLKGSQFGAPPATPNAAPTPPLPSR